jgi:predicted phage terminase large subunit-like protein
LTGVTEVPGWDPRADLPLSLDAYKREVARREREIIERDIDQIRERCRSFAGFVREAWHVIEPGTPLRWNWHLDAMCEHLQAITEGRMTPWLIINVPPGSSKSTIVSVLWQAWEWGPCALRHHRFVSTSFEEGNVTRDTRKCRDLIRSEWYQTLWPDVVLVRAGETSFANSDTGSREGVAFSAITGKRGDRVVIDDPHSLKGAESEAERTATIRLFLEGGLNRSNDAMTSAMVVVMQRLHQDDLTGVLLARKLGFVHLMIPMEFERKRRCRTPIDWTDPRSYEGELMDPGRFPKAAADRQKKAGDYAWNGQYQQRPAPREGGLFKVDNIDIVESCPPGGKTVAGWDFAASKRKKSPFTVRVLMTRVGGDYYVRHVDRRHTNPTELNKMIEEVVEADDEAIGSSLLHSFPQDPGSAGKVQKWNIAEQMAGYKFKVERETGDKETRADPFAAQVGAGRVHLVRGDWNAEYIEELRNFPSGTFKDQVDASSTAFGDLIEKRKKVANAAPEVVEVEANQVRDLATAAREPVDPWGAS